MREHPVRLAVAAAVGLLAMTSLVDSSSIADDNPQRSHVAGPSEAGLSSPAANVTVRLILAGPDGEADANAEPTGDSRAEPDDEPMVEAGGGSAADPDAPDGAPSRDHAEQVTVEHTSEPTPEPSETNESHDPASEPKPTESPDPEPPEDDDADTDDGTCLGVNVLGLTVDLCIPSLLEG